MFDLKQNMPSPEDTVQSFVPQAQSSKFANVPSVLVQSEYTRQLLLDAEQNIDGLQAFVPQVQATGFSTSPELRAHAKSEQVLLDIVQNIPVAVVHMDEPHLQLLLIVPSC